MQLLNRFWVLEGDDPAKIFPLGRVETVAGECDAFYHVKTADRERVPSTGAVYARWEVWGAMVAAARA